MNIEYSKFAIISAEVNNYAPEFTMDTPTVLMVPKDLSLYRKSIGEVAKQKNSCNVCYMCKCVDHITLSNHFHVTRVQINDRASFSTDTDLIKSGVLG